MSKLIKILIFGSSACLLFITGAYASPNLSTSYQSSQSITPGSLVSLDPNNKGFVIPANTNNAGNLIGVVVSTNGSLLAINLKQGLPQVAIGGTANAIVSNINGNISVGNQIVPSPIDGVGMKGTTASREIGVALASFSSSSSGSAIEQIKNNKGQLTNVAVGYIPIEISIQSSNTTTNTGAQNLSLLQKIADNIAGRTVSEGSIIVCALIAIVAFLSLIVLVYGAISSSIIGVSRNPLAKWSIFQALGQVLALASLVIALAIISIYLILR
jgi:hypothetical protein